MTYYGGKELAASFRTVRGNTIKIAEEIPESKYDFSPAPDVRSVRQMLVHLALGPGFQSYIHMNKVSDLKTLNFGELVQQMTAEESKPRSRADILAMLESEGDKYASFLEGLSDEFLAERVAMPPGAEVSSKSRFEMLLSPKEHEMHHRGQLMLVQRMIGQVPHLTRQMQERMAQMQAAAAQAQR